MLISIVGVGFGMRAIDEAEAGGGRETVDGAAGSPKTVEVELGDLYVKPSSIEVAAGTRVIVKVTNKGKMPHDLKLEAKPGPIWCRRARPSRRASASSAPPQKRGARCPVTRMPEW